MFVHLKRLHYVTLRRELTLLEQSVEPCPLLLPSSLQSSMNERVKESYSPRMKTCQNRLRSALTLTTMIRTLAVTRIGRDEFTSSFGWPYFQTIIDLTESSPFPPSY
jgi:hypothetical protein